MHEHRLINETRIGGQEIPTDIRRQLPEGVTIKLQRRSEEVLADTSWQEEPRLRVTEQLYINAEEVGTSLLGEMEKHARRFGALRVEGVISPIDIDETPHLPEFYEHRGYQLIAKGSGFKIVKPL